MGSGVTASSTSAEEKILNLTTDWLSQWFTLLWSSFFICVTKTLCSQVPTPDSRCYNRARDYSIYGNFLVNIILTEKSPQGGTCHFSSQQWWHWSVSFNCRKWVDKYSLYGKSLSCFQLELLMINIELTPPLLHIMNRAGHNINFNKSLANIFSHETW